MIILELNEINLDNKSLSKLNYLSQKINEFKCKIVETIPDSLIEYEGLDHGFNGQLFITVVV